MSIKMPNQSSKSSLTLFEREVSCSLLFSNDKPPAEAGDVPPRLSSRCDARTAAVTPIPALVRKIFLMIIASKERNRVLSSVDHGRIVRAIGLEGANRSSFYHAFEVT